MVHRPILTGRQKEDLLRLPTAENDLLTHYILSNEDLCHINRKRKPSNRFGFALQLCAFRYPGRLLQKNEFIPQQVLMFIAKQLGVSANDLETYGVRSETRYEHSAELQRLYGFKVFQEIEDSSFTKWLLKKAIHTKSNVELVSNFVQECRSRRIILPGITVIERLCADARVSAEREVIELIYSRLDKVRKGKLEKLFEDKIDGRLTIHGWLKRFEVGNNSADVNRLLDKLEYLQELNIPECLLEGFPSHRIIWLRQQGESYYADSFRYINKKRRLAILAVCAVEWRAMICDAILETHDRIVGKLFSSCKRMRDKQLVDQKKLAQETLSSFEILSKKLLKAHADNGAIVDVVQDPGQLETLMLNAQFLTKKIGSNPLEFVLEGYPKFRRYTQRMLQKITFKGNQASESLLEAIDLLREFNQSDKPKEKHLPSNFANTQWKKKLGRKPDRKTWETAILFTVRDSLRSRDIWVSDSKVYRDTKQQLLPVYQAERTLSLPIPLQAEEWIEGRKSLLEKRLVQVAHMIRKNTLPNSCIENGKIFMNRLEPVLPPEGADCLTLDIYKRMPQVSITEILREVAEDTSFTDSFVHIHTGSPCADTVGLLNVILAGGINMGLKKMALCSSSHSSFWPLMRMPAGMSPVNL